MTTLSIHDLEPQLAANRRFWCGWAGDRPDTDLTLYRTDVDHVLFNGVLRVCDQPLDQAVEKAKKHLAGTRWSWWVSADSDEGTADGLAARGGELISDMPVMAIDVTTVRDARMPEGLTIRPAAGDSEVHDYVYAYAGPLGLEGDLDLVVDRELRFSYPNIIRLAGIVDGETVGTCTVSLGTGDVGALYCIATDPAHRRRGIATALTREALRIIRESGRRVATLQASSEGEPVYRNIGFETVSRYRLFTFPE
ncbi:GNAT family N-acetyltransferase [Sphaerisporangium sp. NPDC004334]